MENNCAGCGYRFKGLGGYACISTDHKISFWAWGITVLGVENDLEDWVVMPAFLQTSEFRFWPWKYQERKFLHVFSSCGINFGHCIYFLKVGTFPFFSLEKKNIFWSNFDSSYICNGTFHMEIKYIGKKIT